MTKGVCHLWFGGFDAARLVNMRKTGQYKTDRCAAGDLTKANLKSGGKLRWAPLHSHITHCQPHDTLSSTHIVVAPFVVLVFGLYVDGKLGQEGALEEKDQTVRNCCGHWQLCQMIIAELNVGLVQIANTGKRFSVKLSTGGDVMVIVALCLCFTT